MSKDVKRMVAEIRQSLDAYPREQLVEILSYVFKEYVVEGAAPIAGTTALIDARTELEGLSFAELMTWLQLHLDVPELAQFEVQGNRVSVRAGGRALPVEAPRAEPPAATVAAHATAPQVTPPGAGPAVVAPPPAATPSVTTRPMPATSSGAQPQSSPQAQNPAQTQNPAQPTNPAQPSQQGETKEDAGNPASRFSWLEVD